MFVRMHSALAWRTVRSLALSLSIAALHADPSEAQHSAPVTITGMAEVVDGDGLKIGPIAIRLHGIDAPEDGQRCQAANGGTWPCGQEASILLTELVSEEEVVCSARDRDPYGRIIASCQANGGDVASKIVGAGLAWAYVEYSDDYVSQEAEARDAGQGIWQAKTETPWEYRADRWGRAVAAAPNGCPIKGNISSGGEHVYHTPWSPWYGRTEIDAAEGERWFCDEAEAKEAGWRAAGGR